MSDSIDTVDPEKFYETSDSCQHVVSIHDRADDQIAESEKKNNDVNPKSINDNNEQVNRINEAENTEVEERQIMQMEGSGDEDYQEKQDDGVLVNLMSEHSSEDLNNEDQEFVTTTVDEIKKANNDQGDLNIASISHTLDGAMDMENNNQLSNVKRNFSTELTSIPKIYDSVSAYSNQDFSQISDYSDEDTSDIRKTLSNLVFEECADNNDKSKLGFVEKKTSGEDISDIRGTLSNSVIAGCADVDKSKLGFVEEKTSEVLQTNSCQRTQPNLQNPTEISDEQQKEVERVNEASVSAKNKSNFNLTSARIHGQFQEDVKKCGIRVLQPPGGFSSGLW